MQALPAIPTTTTVTPTTYIHPILAAAEAADLHLAHLENAAATTRTPPSLQHLLLRAAFQASRGPFMRLPRHVAADFVLFLTQLDWVPLAATSRGMLHMISPAVKELYIGPWSEGEMAKCYDTDAVREWLQEARDSNAFLTVLSRFPCLTKLTFKGDTGIVALFAQAVLAGQCSSKIEELDIAGWKSMDGDNGWHPDEIRQLEATGDTNPPFFRLPCLPTFVRALSSDHLPSLRRLKLEEMDVRAADGGPCALLQILEGRHTKGFLGLEEIPPLSFIPDSQLPRIWELCGHTIKTTGDRRYNMGSRDCETFAHFLQNHNAESLEKLFFKMISQKALCSVLEAVIKADCMPRLSSIYFESQHVMRRAMAALTRMIETGKVPQLRKLSFGVSHIETGEDISALIQGMRRAPGRCAELRSLSYFHTDTYTGRAALDLSDLATALEEGTCSCLEELSLDCRNDKPGGLLSLMTVLSRGAPCTRTLQKLLLAIGEQHQQATAVLGQALCAGCLPALKNLELLLKGSVLPLLMVSQPMALINTSSPLVDLEILVLHCNNGGYQLMQALEMARLFRLKVLYIVDMPLGSGGAARLLHYLRDCGQAMEGLRLGGNTLSEEWAAAFIEAVADPNFCPLLREIPEVEARGGTPKELVEAWATRKALQVAAR